MPWRRALLAALAHARGEGVPLDLLTAVTGTLAAVFDDTLVGPGEVAANVRAEEVAEELGRLRFYLRTSVDTDGSRLYRLFHQGLADYLARPRGFTGLRDPRDRENLAERRITGLVFDSLLNTVPRDDCIPRWDLTAAYLRRHLPRHAADAGRVDSVLVDAGFLIYGDRAGLDLVSDLASSDEARTAVAVYRTALPAGNRPADPTVMRDRLAVTAARFAAGKLQRDLLTLPGLQPPGLAPRWATGRQTTPHLRLTVEAHAGLALATTTLDDRPIAVTGGSVRVWDLATGQPHGHPLTGHTGRVEAVATDAFRTLRASLNASVEN